MRKKIFILIALSLSGLSFSGVAQEEPVAVKAFQKHCTACHQAYGNGETLLGNRGSIFSRVNWFKNLSPDFGSMPPKGPFRDQLMQESPEVLQSMIDFIKPEVVVEPAPTPVDQKVAGLKIPKGFKIYRYAKIKSARSMTTSPSGYIFVGTGGFSNPDNKVYAIKDTNGNQKIESNEIRVVAEGLQNPNGVAFRKGSLYVAETQQIRRFDNVEAWLESTSPQERIRLSAAQVLPQKFPSGPGHEWKFIRFAPAPNGHLLYVPVGSFSNVHKETEGFASIFRIDVRGGAPRELVAKGVRNTVGFDFHPQTQDLWFTDNGRDQLGNGFPPDELNKVSSMGEHFGFPYCHGPLRADGKDKDPSFNAGRSCGDFTAPVVALDPHAAALGMRFYKASAFPQEYKNQIFISEHGSWNVDPGVSFKGYKVSSVTEDKDGKFTYKPFISGWLEPDGRTRWGRPVDVEVLSDGSMLISDDGLRNGSNTGSIYRVVYEGS